MKTAFVRQVGRKRVWMALLAAAGLSLMLLWLCQPWPSQDFGRKAAKAPATAVQSEASAAVGPGDAGNTSPAAGTQIPPERLQAFRQAIAAKGLVVPDPLLSGEQPVRLRDRTRQLQAGPHSAAPVPLDPPHAFDFANAVREDGVSHVTGSNTRQGMQFEFDPTGLHVSSGAGVLPADTIGGSAASDWALNMKVQGFRRGQARQEFAPAVPEGSGPRAEYRRSEVTEWYANDLRGLEQGFTVASKPLAAPGQASAEPLRIQLAVESTLQAIPASDGSSLHFKDGQGNTILRYGALQAFDANRRELPAEFEFAVASAGQPMQLALKVDDREAVYPVTVDPILTAESFIDLNTRPVSGAPLGRMTVLNGVAYFAADDRIHGGEMWRSDGTPEGTWMILDLAPGAASSCSWKLSDPVVVNNRVYFVASTPEFGYSMWRSDGEASGTERVAGLPGIIDGMDQAIFCVVADRYVVLRQFVDHYPTIMVLDTVTGQLSSLLEFAPPEAGPYAEIYGPFKPVGDKLFYTASDNVHGRELWVSDFSTARKTKMVKDIYPGYNTPGLGLYGEYQGKLYFLASDLNHGMEPWVSDGTADGTYMLEDLSPGSANTIAFPFGAAGDYLYYYVEKAGQATYQLWRYKPTTGLEFFIDTGSSDLNSAFFGALPGGQFFFATADRVTYRSQVWFSEGTADKTAPVGPSLGLGSMAVVGNRLFFEGNDYVHGPELWTSDGTTAGTRMVKDIRVGSEGALWYGGFASPTALGGQVLFYAHDGEQQGIWRSDGTEAGTLFIKGFWPGTTADGVFGPVALANTSLYFWDRDAGSGGPLTLWKSDGTITGTVPVKTFPWAMDVKVHAAGNRLFIRLCTDAETSPGVYERVLQLWKTDGQEADTLLLKQFPYTYRYYDPWQEPFVAAVAGQRLVFWADDGITGMEPWVSDGTPGGTVLLKDITPGLMGSSYYPTPDEIVSTGNTVYFATKSTADFGLWKTDGTPNHTEELKAGPAQILTAFGSTVFFVSGADLWKTDGTATTTVFVRAGNPAPGQYSTPLHITAVGNLLFFCANYPPELWVTDGTLGGDMPLKDLSMGDGAGNLSMTALGNLLIFSAAEKIPGNYLDRELWRSDGTPQGTWMIKDINPGLNGSSPVELRTIGGLVYFSANDGVHGAEPWVTDGTPEGTYMVSDIYEGSMSSSPESFEPLNGQVFCIARGIMQGRELWAIDAASPEITGLNPASAAVDSPSVTLTVTGEFFDPAAVINWNGVARTTTFVSASQLSTVIPASDLTGTEDIRMAAITVQNPDGRISNPAVFSILNAETVANFASGLALPGQPAAVSVPATGTEPGLSANILNPDGGAMSVTVARYVSNPTPGLVFDVGGGFVDLQVIGADNRDQVTATFLYPLSVTGDAEAALQLLYFDGSNWVEVRSSGNTAPIKDTLDSAIAGGRFTVVFDATSTPPITALSGTVFTFSAPILTLVQAPTGPVQIGAAVSVTMVVTPLSGSSLNLTFDWGDGSPGEACGAGAGIITATHTYPAPGVYTVTITASDGTIAVASYVFKYVVVYNPLGGFVTGGGWINSPAGAYTPNPVLAGKATFGFVAKYLKGANVPSGNTEFQFKAGDLNFKSTSYQWLVVAGPHAQFKGEGTINGQGNYGFKLTAVDGQVNGGGGVDRFRIKIWDAASGAMVYDNQSGADDTAALNDATIIQGGSIVIQKP